MIRRHIIFHGRVQGVGFRYTARYIASDLGLSGWVSNLWDGSVEMEVQGKKELIDEMIRRLARQRYIMIEDMDIREIPVEDESGFHVK